MSNIQAPSRFYYEFHVPGVLHGRNITDNPPPDMALYSNPPLLKHRIRAPPAEKYEIDYEKLDKSTFGAASNFQSTEQYALAHDKA